MVVQAIKADERLEELSRLLYLEPSIEVSGAWFHQEDEEELFVEKSIFFNCRLQ